jgi:Omp85 superfamily domain
MHAIKWPGRRFARGRRAGAGALAAVGLTGLLFAACLPTLAEADGGAPATPGAPAITSAQAIQPTAAPAPKGVQFVGVPVPLSDPALGSGIEPVIMLLYAPRGSGGTWTTGFAGLYTSTKSKAFGVFQKAHLDDDRFRLTAALGYGDFNLKFFGIGGALASQDKSININQTGEAALIEGLVRVAPHTYLGARYFLIDTTTTLPPIQIGGIAIPFPQLRSTSSELGPSAVYDTRDSEYGPRRGIYVTGQWLFASQALGSKFQYDKLTIDANAYFTLTPTTVLAARVSLCAAGREAPFYDLCLYGSRNDLRGYAAGQYRDHRLAAAQIELRQHLFWRIGMVAFAGVGGTAPGDVSSNPFAKATFLPSAGVGLRFLASKAYRVNLSIDVAEGVHSQGLYIYVGEAF